jgi:hypothetical protein
MRSKQEGAMGWTYSIEEIRFGQPILNLEKQLNKVGEEGWEAVSALPAEGNSPGVVFVLFKKPK